MEGWILKAEGVLRLSSLLLATLAACLVGLDTQTKLLVFGINKKATMKDLQALPVMVIVESVAAGYQFLQLCKSTIKANPSSCNKTLAWFNFLLDQMVAYVSFAAVAAAAQASCLAITGAEDFQWTKWCGTYTRFCEQIGGGLFSALLSNLLMAAIASISAFHVFQNFYSKKSLAVN